MPFEIPTSWEWVQLSDLCEIKGGKRIPKGKSFASEPTQHIYIRVTDMKNNTIIDNDLQYVNDDVFSIIRNYIIHQDDLYLTIAGTIGAVGEVPTQFDGMNLTENAAKLTNIKCNKKYLMYALLSSIAQDHFKSKFHQVAQPKLSIETASTTFVPLPPIKEQERIVIEIEKLLGQISNLEDCKTDLQEYIKQTKSKILSLAISGKLVPQDPNDEPATELLKRINPSFIPCDTSHYENLPETWCVAHMGEVYNHTTGKALKKADSAGELRQYITTSNVYWNSFDFTEVRSMYFTEKELDKCTAHKGDLLVCNGGDVGRAAIWDYDYDICYQNHISRLRPKCDDIVFNPFYSYLFRYLKDKGQLNGKGVAITSLSATDIQSLAIPVPPLAEQKRIVKRIETIFAQLDTITAEL